MAATDELAYKPPGPESEASAAMPNDWSWSAWRADIGCAAALLSRLPVPAQVPERADWARATRAFPLVGAGIGLIGGAAFWFVDSMGLPPLIAGLIAVGVTIWASGALHEDGLADVADGFGGGRDRGHKLAIMRDSRIGAYGVLALVLSVGLRVAALASLAEPPLVVTALVAAHAVARAPLAAVMALTPLARPDGLAASTGKPGLGQALTALILGLLVALFVLGPAEGFTVWLVAGLAAVILLSLARGQIGGYTGDVLGAIEQAGEAVALLCLVALR